MKSFILSLITKATRKLKKNFQTFYHFTFKVNLKLQKQKISEKQTNKQKTQTNNKMTNVPRASLSLCIALCNVPQLQPNAPTLEATLHDLFLSHSHGKDRRQWRVFFAMGTPVKLQIN